MLNCSIKFNNEPGCRTFALCSNFSNTWLHDAIQHELDSNSLLKIQPQHFLDLLHIGATATQEDKKTQ
jgi:hypothetical protein